MNELTTYIGYHFCLLLTEGDNVCWLPLFYYYRRWQRLLVSTFIYYQQKLITFIGCQFYLLLQIQGDNVYWLLALFIITEGDNVYWLPVLFIITEGDNDYWLPVLFIITEGDNVYWLPVLFIITEGNIASASLDFPEDELEDDTPRGVLQPGKGQVCH